MFEAPLLNIWFDMIIIVLVFAVLNKLVQHLTIDPKHYFYVKKKGKDINREIKELSKQQKMAEVKEKQKEAFKMVGEQFKMTKKSMFVMLIIAFPLLWFVKKYYGELVYNFSMFTVNGFWAYVILGVIISMIISGIYDKVLIKKYYPKGTTAVTETK